MHTLAQQLYLFFANLGAGGLFLLGILDSSFLFMPLGNDLLIVGLASRNHGHLWWYVPIAAAGSTAGCWLLDLVCRKRGEEGLKKMLPEKRVEYLKRRIGNNAALALFVASMAPPPFPFTPVVAAASAFDYPRNKMLAVILVSRIVRFTIVGLLAVWFGSRILEIAKSPGFEWSIGIFIGLCVIGSAWSIYQWVGRMRRT